ncbi:hypothetical protein ACTWPB_16480 [Nocardia sp. IBHARD005]|uniref:hypothetical protein n=1 Tax=Nocardia sp. IBHARD005 TaxID=3457765 RepID=UPI0040590FBA
MNTLTRTLITTFPLLCVAGVAAAPAAAHPTSGDAATPSVSRPAETTPPAGLSSTCAGGDGAVVLARPPARRIGEPIFPPQHAAAPGTVPVAPAVPHRKDTPPETAGSCGRAPVVVPVIVVPRRELVPAPAPVRVTIHDLGSVPARPRSVDQSAGARSEIEIVVRAGGGSGSAAELPSVLREMLRTLGGQQRVPTPRQHR